MTFTITVEEYFSLSEEKRKRVLEAIRQKEEPLTEDEEEILNVEYGYFDENPYYENLEESNDAE